ncbi:hypothetical protein DFH27DRAFT_219321 [Peziza echinospora]|nr:hypothetical protein DFH27DRAFT_219321 [Peziza echinospora]
MSKSISQGQAFSPPPPVPMALPAMPQARPNSGTISPVAAGGIDQALLLKQLPVIYLTIEKRNSSPRVYNIPIDSIDTWEKFIMILLNICPAEARALLISSDGPGSQKSYIIPNTWPGCLSPGREFLLQLGSCIKDPECPVCFKLTLNGLTPAGGGVDGKPGGGGGGGAGTTGSGSGAASGADVQPRGGGGNASGKR